MKPRYVIKQGKSIIYSNAERDDKIALKEKRDSIARDSGMDQYDRLAATSPNTQEEAVIQQEIESLRRAGKLPYLSKEAG
jgi:hypothetical protein